jgi:Reverse transcriptase (RNA-dependent DNA polymerase)./Integrase core domain.
MVEGVGDFHIESWIDGKSNRLLTIPCVYILTIPSTLVNFQLVKNAIMHGEVSNLVTNEAVGTLIVGSPDDFIVHKIPLELRGNRVYTSNLLTTDHVQNCFDVPPNQIAIVSDEATRLLWHARLGHLNFRALSSMHLFARGVPKFKQSHVIDQCETCLETKLRRSPRGHGSIAARAEVHGQILCGDWGFICQKSSDPTQITWLSSVHGDTSYLIFVCAHTGALYGVCGGSKSVPTKWLHVFLHRIAYSAGKRPKTVLVDRGSELGRSDEFCAIAALHGYKTITAGPDKSSMNSLGERPHSTIGNAIRSMLYSAGLDLKYWNFAFYHFIRLFNFFPHGQHSKSPFEQIYGYRPDLSLLRVFGCNVYIRPRRSSKLDLHVIKGRFLGYTSTLKQIYYLEDSTNKIKIAAHARFDEGLASVPLHSLPPYACQLRKALGHLVLEVDDNVISSPSDLDLLSCAERFPITFSHRFAIKSSDISNEHDTLGFILRDDPVLRCCYIADIIPCSTAAQFRHWRSCLIGSFILTVDEDDIVSNKLDAEAALSCCLVDSSTANSDSFVSITFAHDRSLIHLSLSPEPPSPIQLDQIYHISQIFETGEEIKYQPRLDSGWFQYFDNLVNQLSDSADEFIQKTTSSQFTRKQLMQRDDFASWREAEYKQLDTHESDGMFGKPCPRPRNAIVLRSIWSYSLKRDGTRKARNCGDGRPLRDDHCRRLESVYTACVSQVGVKIFFALSALLNYVIFDLDAVNAFGQAGKIFQTVYLEVDQQYRDWFLARKKKEIPHGWVLPVHGSLQGHPDSGKVWQNKINEVIASYGFQSTTHESCLYRGKYKGMDILICRQVDDMLLAGESANNVKDFAKDISSKLKVTFGDSPSKHFNGLDIVQTREGIQINCSTYIRKLQTAHGWNEVSKKPLEPISPNKVKELESTEGPPVDSKEGKALQKLNGFNYRGVVGEIVYAYIVAHPDYGFAVALLSHFNTCPSQCHYDAAKRCLKSLIWSATDGIWLPCSTYVESSMAAV